MRIVLSRLSKKPFSCCGRDRETKRFPTGIRKAETALSAEENGVFQGFFAEKPIGIAIHSLSQPIQFM